MARITGLLRFAFASAVLLALGLATHPVDAQQGTDPPRALTAADYARAERLLNYNTTSLVFRSGIRPAWFGADRFWYRVTTQTGSEFLTVDPSSGTKTAAFDHAKLAASLSAAAGAKYNATQLPFTEFTRAAEGDAILFSAARRRWRCEADASKCAQVPGAAAEEEGGGRGGRGGRGGARPEVASPDGTRVAFIRNYNLWVRDVVSGKETALTADGVKDFGYATDNASWSRSERPILRWSPDSKKIATFQHDGRKVGEMYLIDTRVGHPQLQAWKYPLPGDEHIFMIERVVIDVPTATVVRFKMDPDPHRSTLCDHVACRGDWGDVQWHANGSKLAFVSSSRDHKAATLRVADTSTGEVRTFLTEKVDTFYESGNGRVNWRYLPASN